MRKNLLLLIMFCLIATIGAKAKATATISGTTLTITTEKAGEVEDYFQNKSDLTYTSFTVVGPMNGYDIQSMKAFKNGFLQSLDLSLATGLTSTDITFYNGNGGTLQNNLSGSLKSIKFPKGPTEIPASCLYQFTALQSVIIPSGYTKIGADAFRNCKSLVIINIPEGIKTICSYAFSQATIQSIRLPKSLNTIENNAFDDCEKLASITIPENVTTIGANAFLCCKNIKDIYVLGTTTIPVLGENAFDQDTYDGCGGNVPEIDNTGVVNRESYWKSNHLAVVHFKGDVSNFRNSSVVTKDIDDKVKEGKTYDNYTLGGDGILDKYPTYEEAHDLHLYSESKKIWDWTRFTLATKIKNNEIIDIPHITASRWYTMCFDFPMTKGQIESAFGAGTEVCRFQGVKKENSSDGDGIIATLDFSQDLYTSKIGADVTITKAGYPYMIHPAADVPYTTSPVYYISGVTKDATCTEGKSDYGQQFGDIDKPTKKIVENYYPYGDFIFKGSLTETKVPTGNYYLGLYKESADKTFTVTDINGKSATVNEDGYEDGHRAFFYNLNNNELTWPAYAATIYEVPGTIHHAATSSHNAKTAIAFGNSAVIYTTESSTTGIENTESESSNETSAKFADKVFSISGQLVRTGSSSLDGLAKGMYIVNGKKYIVK